VVSFGPWLSRTGVVATLAWLVAGQGAALAQPLPAPVIAAQAYLLLDVASGQVIVAESADERLDPASLT